MRHTRTFVAVVCAVLALVATNRMSAQIKSDTLTIRQIQEVHPDSLAAKKYNSPYLGDTVTVTGVVVAAPRRSQGGPMLFALGNAATVYIADPAGGPWTGLNLRASDTVASAGTLITAVDTGYVIRVTGVVTQYFTTTQFDIGKIASWNADVQVEILDQLPSRPAPNAIQISDLVAGDPLAGKPEGQQWEGAYVSIKNSSVGTLSTNPSTGRHTWTITDGNGNSIGVYDQSVYFRGGSQGINPSWTPPPPGTKIAEIRGIITSSGQGTVIAPIYPGDMVLGSFPPVISKVQRSVVIPTSSETVDITATIEDTDPDASGTITEATLIYGTGDTELGRLAMTWNAASKEAEVQIPAQANGSTIWYYITAKDNSNETTQWPVDISKARPFYIVRDGALRIRDVQYTPYADGVPGCVGAIVTLRGTVVADSTLGMIYMQDGTDPWSGILLRGDAAIRTLGIGEDVTVTGKVAEGYSSGTNGNTALIDATVATKHGSATVPAAIVLPTNTFESDVVRDGTPSAEQYEGMLVRFENLTVTTPNADAGAGSNFGEFGVTDGSGMMRVDDIGTWKTVYTTDSTKTALTFLRTGTKMTSLTGVMFFSFGNYKLQPRGASDFQGVVTSIERVSAVPSALKLHAVHPNPVSIARNGSAIVTFDLATSQSIVMTLHDALGRETARLADGRHDAGSYRATINSASLAAGVYFVRLATPAGIQTTRLVVVR